MKPFYVESGDRVLHYATLQEAEAAAKNRARKLGQAVKVYRGGQAVAEVIPKHQRGAFVNLTELGARIA